MKWTRDLLVAALCVIAMTVFVTWPQARHMLGSYVWHMDPEFSMWRLGWVAHALAHDPRHLFAANIFYPQPNTLTYSDAMLLEGVLAAPLFWLGFQPIFIYNLMLFAGIAGSGLAMYVLVRELTGGRTPAFFAAAVFTMAPYRIEHIMHLELQWAMWIPLTFWALYLAIRRPDAAWRYGLLAGLFVWLQIMSCVYYGVFLAMAVVVFMAVEVATNWRRVLAAMPMLAAGGVLAALLTSPYLWVYLSTARTLGPRDMMEIAVYSGRYWSYFSAPPQNWLRGWTVGLPELNLFLGWNAMALAVVGAFFYRSRDQRIIYGAIAVLGIALSLGVNTPVYKYLLAAVPTFQGLRSPSRFSIVACCAVAVLVGFGVAALRERLAAGRVSVVLSVLFVFMAAEYANTGLVLFDRSHDGPGTVYKAMQSAGPGVLAELPMPQADALPGQDTVYEYWSLSHWHPLVNGYSGYYTPQYIETLTRMLTFPDEESIARLKRLDVRYLIVHCEFYTTNGTDPGCTRDFLIRMGGQRSIHAIGKYVDPMGGPSYLFTLDP